MTRSLSMISNMGMGNSLPNPRSRSHCPPRPSLTLKEDWRPSQDSTLELRPRHRHNRVCAGLAVDKEVADLYERSQVCPHAHFFSGDLGEYENVCLIYGIPNDVVVSRVTSDKIRDKGEQRPEHITIPLMAICKAGLCFPHYPFLRELFTLPLTYSPSTVLELSRLWSR